MSKKIWLTVVCVVMLGMFGYNMKPIYSQGFEGIIYFRNLEANDQIIQNALMSKFREDVMDKLYENESEDILPFAKKVFELTIDDLQKASKLEMMEDGFVLTEGKLYVSPNKMRFDTSMEGQNFSYITLIDKNVMFNVLWDQNAYMEIDMKEILKQTQAVSEKMKEMLGNIETDENSKMGKPKLLKTGNKKTINGFDCEEVIAYNNQEAQQVWLTQNSLIKKIMEEWENKFSGMFKGDAEESGISSLIDQQDGLPIIDSKYDGSMLTIDEVVKIEKKSLDSELFKVPTGFKKMSMMDMMKMRQN